MVTKLSHPCDRQQRHAAFANYSTTQDYKMNCKTMDKYLNNHLYLHASASVIVDQHDRVQARDMAMGGCRHGVIVCSARCSEYAHIVTTWCCTMNLATKMR